MLPQKRLTKQQYWRIMKDKSDFLKSNGVEFEEKETKKRTKKSSAKLPIGEDEIRNAIQTLNDYKAKKQNFDKRVIDNEEWWKMRHWNSIRSEKQDTEPTSAWLFNSIMKIGRAHV